MQSRLIWEAPTAGIPEAALLAELGAVTPTHAAQLVRALAAQGLLHARAAPAARRCGPPRLFGRRGTVAVAREQARTSLGPRKAVSICWLCHSK